MLYKHYILYLFKKNKVFFKEEKVPQSGFCSQKGDIASQGTGFEPRA